MNDKIRKKLTTWLHGNDKVSGFDEIENTLYAYYNGAWNHVSYFTSPQDFFDLKDKLVEKRLWHKFMNYSETIWRLSPIEFDQDDDDGDARSSIANWLINVSRIEDCIVPFLKGENI
jgi:hypothetical protein